jgi:metal-responsive CopG/Arc/MetJ family transcriptional regulator
MARKPVLVQLDDQLVEQLDELATETGISRSELVRRGAVALLEAYRVRRDDVRLVEAYRRQPQDPVLVETAARLAAETAPPW